MTELAVDAQPGKVTVAFLVAVAVPSRAVLP